MAKALSFVTLCFAREGLSVKLDDAKPIEYRTIINKDNPIQVPDHDTAIFAMGCGYTAWDLAPFLVSLRRWSNTTVHIGLGNDLDPEERRSLEQWGVVVETGPCEEQLRLQRNHSAGAYNAPEHSGAVQHGPQRMDVESTGRELSYSDEQLNMDAYYQVIRKGSSYDRAPVWMGNLNQRRWTWYKQWLSKHNYTHVWCLDVRDVIFQTNPFHTAEPIAPLEIATDFAGWYDSFNVARVANCLGEDVWTRMVEEKMLNYCAGAIAGTREGLLDFFDEVESLVDTPPAMNWKPCYVNDQHIVQHALYRRGLRGPGTAAKGGWRTRKDGAGPMINLWLGHNRHINHPRIVEYLTPNNKRKHHVVNADDTIVPVLHKYLQNVDVKGYWGQIVGKQYPSWWKYGWGDPRRLVGGSV